MLASEPLDPPLPPGHCLRRLRHQRQPLQPGESALGAGVHRPGAVGNRHTAWRPLPSAPYTSQAAPICVYFKSHTKSPYPPWTRRTWPRSRPSAPKPPPPLASTRASRCCPTPPSAAARGPTCKRRASGGVVCLCVGVRRSALRPSFGPGRPRGPTPSWQSNPLPSPAARLSLSHPRLPNPWPPSCRSNAPPGGGRGQAGQGDAARPQGGRACVCVGGWGWCACCV